MESLNIELITTSQSLEKCLILVLLRVLNNFFLINRWDLKYYMHKRVETEFSVNEEAIREYFPLDYVTESMLELYQTLLSLKFEQVYRLVGVQKY